MPMGKWTIINSVNPRILWDMPPILRLKLICAFSHFAQHFLIRLAIEGRVATWIRVLCARTSSNVWQVWLTWGKHAPVAISQQPLHRTDFGVKIHSSYALLPLERRCGQGLFRHFGKWSRKKQLKLPNSVLFLCLDLLKDRMGGQAHQHQKNYRAGYYLSSHMGWDNVSIYAMTCCACIHI